MGRQKRKKPKHLASKLLAVRRNLGLTQWELAERLGTARLHARISEYESGRREPNLMVILAYARLAGISTDVLIDDKLEITLPAS